MSEYIKLAVRGLHCRSCEILVEEKLKEIKSVTSAEVNYKTGEVVIHYMGDNAPQALISQAILDAGYELGEPDKLPIVSNDKKVYFGLGFAFLVLIALYLIFKGLGLANLTPNLASPSWPLIVVIGLVAGFSTCMALVGGLSLGLSAKFLASHPNATPAEKFHPHIYFIIGRVLSYAFLGGLLGALGAFIQFSALANAILTLIIGLVMLLMGLQLIGIFPRLSKFKLTLPKGLAKVLGLSQTEREYSPERAMVLGALTFFLPCGFTQAMQLYAISTGTFGAGALVMGLFALGTAPGLLSIGGVTALVKGQFKQKFFQFAGVAIIFFALFNLNNGYALATLGFGLGGNNQTPTASDSSAGLAGDVQVVNMTETASGYSPRTFSVKAGVPVRWLIDAEEPYSCASTIVMPKLGIEKSLTAGENEIDFTPTESGTLPFSCSMGMYTGSFTIYE